MRVCVVAHVVRPAPDDAWGSSTRQVPTFYLDGDVSGFVTIHQSAHVAADVLASAARKGDRIILALSTSDATATVSYVVTTDYGTVAYEGEPAQR